MVHSKNSSKKRSGKKSPTHRDREIGKTPHVDPNYIFKGMLSLVQKQSDHTLKMNEMMTNKLVNHTNTPTTMPASASGQSESIIKTEAVVKSEPLIEPEIVTNKKPWEDSQISGDGTRSVSTRRTYFLDEICRECFTVAKNIHIKKRDCPRKLPNLSDGEEQSRRELENEPAFQTNHSDTLCAICKKAPADAQLDGRGSLIARQSIRKHMVEAVIDHAKVATNDVEKLFSGTVSMSNGRMVEYRDKCLLAAENLNHQITGGTCPKTDDKKQDATTFELMKEKERKPSECKNDGGNTNGNKKHQATTNGNKEHQSSANGNKQHHRRSRYGGEQGRKRPAKSAHHDRDSRPKKRRDASPKRNDDGNANGKDIVIQRPPPCDRYGRKEKTVKTEEEVDWQVWRANQDWF